MIRVLHVVSAMNRGGLETFIINVYRQIDRNKIQFDFLVHAEGAYDEEIKNLGGRIYSVPSRRKGLFKYRRALNLFFRNHLEYEIVHVHLSSLSDIEPLKAAKKNHIRTRIVHAHSTRQNGCIVHALLHLWHRFFINRFATDFFACSDLAGVWLYGKNGKFTLINNGIELERFEFDAGVRKKYREELGVEDKVVIGHVGRFAYPKNHDFLLDIFKSFMKREPDSMLLLIGDGELREKTYQKCQRLGLCENVIFAGTRPDVNGLLQAMDCFVFPSHYEGLPLSLVEAQVAGLLCFASNRITQQVNVSEQLHSLSLDMPADDWAALIFENIRLYKRDNKRSYRFDTFDIRKIAKNLTDFYSSESEKNRNAV